MTALVREPFFAWQEKVACGAQARQLDAIGAGVDTGRTPDMEAKLARIQRQSRRAEPAEDDRAPAETTEPEVDA